MGKRLDLERLESGTIRIVDELSILLSFLLSLLRPIVRLFYFKMQKV